MPYCLATEFIVVFTCCYNLELGLFAKLTAFLESRKA
jgi:hypothetical protein